MHRFSQSLALILPAVLLAGCGAGTPVVVGPDASIVVGSIYPPVTLDVAVGGGQGSTEVLYRNVYEPVLTLQEDGTVTSGVAASDTVSEDGLTYTFTLREKATFHSGRPVTAEDVKFSYDTLLSPSSKSARKSDLSVIDKVEATDPRTVTITLKQRATSFRYMSTYVWVLPKDGGNDPKGADGTGPYKVTDYQPGTSITLTRNDTYWGEKPKNKEVVFRYFTDESAQTNALKSGQIDIIANVASPEQVKAFQNITGFTISEGQSTTKQVLAFNDRREPFSKPDVRRAIRRAVNREAIRKATWDDHGKPIGSFVPPQEPWYEDLTSLHPYNPDQAKKDLATAGHPDGFSFNLVTPSSDVHLISAQAIKTDLAKIGITVNIEPIDPSAWYSKVYQSRDFDATLQEHVNDRDLVWYGNPDFYWGYDNPQVARWVKEAEAAPDEAAQHDIYRKIGRQIAEDAASDWLYLYPQLRISASNVEGYPKDGKNSAFFAGNITKS